VVVCQGFLKIPKKQDAVILSRSRICLGEIKPPSTVKAVFLCKEFLDYFISTIFFVAEKLRVLRA
jgi:hypothetical protein